MVGLGVIISSGLLCCICWLVFIFSDCSWLLWLRLIM